MEDEKEKKRREDNERYYQLASQINESDETIASKIARVGDYRKKMLKVSAEKGQSVEPNDDVEQFPAQNDYISTDAGEFVVNQKQNLIQSIRDGKYWFTIYCVVWAITLFILDQNLDLLGILVGSVFFALRGWLVGALVMVIFFFPLKHYFKNAKIIKLIDENFPSSSLIAGYLAFLLFFFFE